MIVKVVIPVLNEAASIGKVLADIPDFVDEVLVVDNGCTDNTSQIARENKATVVAEPRRGYGQACLAGIAACGNCDVIVFMDGDYSDHPEQMHLMVEPIAKNQADLVIGSRVLGQREHRALTYQARFGNWLACSLIRCFWKIRFTDLGPFRAIRTSALKTLGMCDTNYGWTVEMQVKAARKSLPIREVPVDYRRRIGKSKISGTLRGITGAGIKILGTIFLSALVEHLTACRASDRLVVFTRYPEPGKTKTRMISALGPMGACQLHRQMTLHTLYTARTFTRHRRCSMEVRYEGGDLDRMSNWLGSDLAYKKQGSGDLGCRMADTFHQNFRRGVKRVAIIGTDCPEVTEKLLQTAFNLLRRYDLVLGPAVDGGYYLIALRSSVNSTTIDSLFSNIRWGTSEVLAKTIQIARDQKLNFKFLKRLNDVDRPEDLVAWNHVAKRFSSTKDHQISVIIPTCNEQDHLIDVLTNAKRNENAQIIVVDAGSNDRTVQIARSYDVEAITCKAGRAAQMNAAAQVATGQILLFLHADTKLPCRYDHYIRQVLSKPNVVAGAFELGIEAPHDALRLIEYLANWRSRRMHLPYGDQAIFVRTDIFRKIGGYRDMPIMEDYDLAQRLSRQGHIKILPLPIVTSARRWLKVGIFKTTFINQLVIVGYELGVSPETLTKQYQKLSCCVENTTIAASAPPDTL